METSTAPEAVQPAFIARAQFVLALSQAADDSLPEEIMWAPAGTHEIVAMGRDNKPKRCKVQVDEAAATVMEDYRRRISAESGGNLAPFFDFDHRGGAASAWPTSFYFKADGERPGIYARVTWSAGGEAAYRGKDYRSFSPTAYLDKKGRIVGGGEYLDPNMGGLVNNPAFRQMAPLWPIQGSAIQTEPKEKEDMENNEALVAAKDAEISQLKTQLEAAQKAAADESTRAKEQVRAAAKTVVEAAVLRGAIPAKNEALKARWVDIIADKPEAAELLASVPTHAALGSTITQPEGVRAKNAADPEDKRSHSERLQATFAEDVEALRKDKINAAA